MNKSVLLEVLGLGFDYQLERDYQINALLHNVCFTVPEGSLLHLQGQNGSGKTTLLQLLAGLLYPMEGDIRYGGESILRHRSAYQEHLAYVGHKTGVSSVLTVWEQCQFELQCVLSTTEIDALLRRFSLFEWKNKRCGLLSTGQRRRVGLLRLMLSQARLWLLDEPFVALDHQALSLLVTCLLDHVRSGGQVILTSHQALPCVLEPHQVYSL